MQWYALQVRTQYEQRLSDALSGFDAFYPYHDTRVRLGARDVVRRTAFFPGSVCARFHEPRDLPAVAIPQGWHLVSPSPIPDVQIESVRLLHLSKRPLIEHPNIRIGQTVRLTKGILAGVEGKLLTFAEKGHLLVVRLDVLDKSVATPIKPEWIEACEPVKRTVA